MFEKYIKPRSLTWWASLVPILLGVVMATEPLHGGAALVLSIQSMTGGMSAYAMINAGLVGIGLRGAVA